VPTYTHKLGLPLSSDSYYEIQAIQDTNAYNIYKVLKSANIGCDYLPKYFSDENQVFWTVLNGEYHDRRISLDFFELVVKLMNDITVLIFYKKDLEMAHYLMRILLTLIYQTDDRTLIVEADKYYMYYLLAIERWPNCPISREYKYEPGEEDTEI